MKELLEDTRIRFIVGLAMLIAGSYMFISKVYVSSNFFSTGVKIGEITVRSGVLVFPFIAGLVWMFFKPQSILAKVLCGIGIAAIVIYAIASVNIRVSAIPIVRWIIILFLIVAGSVLVVTAIAKRRKMNTK